MGLLYSRQALYPFLILLAIMKGCVTSLASKENIKFADEFHKTCQNPQSEAFSNDIRTLHIRSGTSDCEDLLNFLVRVEALNLDNTNFSELGLLKPAQNLTSLSLRKNGLNSIEGLKYLKKLEELYLEDNKLNRIEDIKELSSLTQLHLAGNKLTSIEPLKSLRKLYILDISNNEITELDSISRISSIFAFNARGNKIEKANCDEEKMMSVKVKYFCRNLEALRDK